MTDSTLPPEGQPEYLSSDSPSDKRHTKKIIGGVAALALLAGAAGVGAYAWSVLNSSGDYPFAHLSPDAIGYVQINVDPDAEQKLAINELSKKFPELDEEEAETLEADNLNEAILQDILSDTYGQEEYAGDLSWVGDRMAVAAYPDDSDEDSEPQIAILIETTDASAATTAIPDLEEALSFDPNSTMGGDEEFGADYMPEPKAPFTGELYGEKWVGLTNGSAPADYFETESSLADTDNFTETFDEVKGNVFGAWVDAEGLSEIVEDDGGMGTSSLLGATGATATQKIEGQASFGVSVRDDGIDFVSYTDGVLIDGEAFGATGSASDAERLLEDNSYEDAAFSIGFAGLGDAIEKAIEANPDSATDSYEAGDARGLLGDQIALSVSGDRLEELQGKLVAEGVDPAVINKYLAEENMNSDDLETMLSSQLQREVEVVLEDEVFSVTVGEEPSGGQDFEEGQVTGRIGLDQVASIIHNFSLFGDTPEGEAPTDLGVIEFWSKMDENGDGEGRLSWTTPR